MSNKMTVAEAIEKVNLIYEVMQDECIHDNCDDCNSMKMVLAIAQRAGDVKWIEHQLKSFDVVGCGWRSVAEEFSERLLNSEGKDGVR